MTFDEARKLFLEQKELGGDSLMVRLDVERIPVADHGDYIVADRLFWFEQERKEGMRK